MKSFTQILDIDFSTTDSNMCVQIYQTSIDTLLEETGELIKTAEKEFKYGRKAGELLSEKSEPPLLAIACWHYERSARKYRAAAESVSKLLDSANNDKRRFALRQFIKQILNCAERADKTAESLVRVEQQKRAAISDQKRRISHQAFGIGMNSREKILFA